MKRGKREVCNQFSMGNLFEDLKDTISNPRSFIDPIKQSVTEFIANPNINTLNGIIHSATVEQPRQPNTEPKSDSQESIFDTIPNVIDKVKNFQESIINTVSIVNTITDSISTNASTIEIGIKNLFHIENNNLNNQAPDTLLPGTNHIPDILLTGNLVGDDFEIV